MREQEAAQIAEALSRGQSLLVLGEPGSGKSTLAGTVRSRLMNHGYTVAIGTYSGSAKETLNDLADQLGVDLAYVDANGKAKNKTAQQIRGDILKELTTSKSLLICDDAHRWSASLRYWLEDCWRAGAILLLLAYQPKSEGIFAKLPLTELSAIADQDIRKVLMTEAEAHGLKLSIQELASLQSRAGNNPTIAKRIIKEATLGISGDRGANGHYQYVDGTPLLLSMLLCIGMIRFVGLGLGDRSLYIMGGLLTIVGIAIRTALYAANRGGRRL
jgi:energy-coupling factor transporter ATP-binding protein EcfA2